MTGTGFWGRRMSPKDGNKLKLRNLLDLFLICLSNASFSEENDPPFNGSMSHYNIF